MFVVQGLSGRAGCEDAVQAVVWVGGLWLRQ